MQGTIATGGLSKARLRLMHDVMAGHVESGGMPGLVTLMSRHGDVHVDAIGKMAAGGAPIERDSIFRIASMTKPIGAVAAMILVEDANCGSTIPSTSFCRNSPTARCCARSMPISTTPCLPSARSRCATC